MRNQSPRVVFAPGLWPLGAPLYAELLLGWAVGLVGTALAARGSDASAAAFALAQHLAGAVFIVFRVVGAGVGVVVAQALGAGNPPQAAAIARACLGAATWVGAAAAFVCAGAAAPLLRAVNAPPEVLPQAASMLVWLAPALWLDAWHATLGGVLRAHLRMRWALGATVLAHGLHMGLAFWWMPTCGLPGFALALLASRVASVLWQVWMWHRLSIGLRAADVWRLRPRLLAPVLRIGVPGAAENIAYRLCMLLSLAAVGTMGSAALATHAYVQQINIAVLLAGLATGLAVEIRTSRFVGAGSLRQAHEGVLHGLRWGMGLSLVGALLAALAGSALLGLFTPDAQIVQQGLWLLWCTALLEPGRSFNLVVINALRAAGDAVYPVAVGALSMLSVLGGGSWLLGHHLGLGLLGVWLAYTADEWLRGLLMWRRWQRLAWVPKARAERRRHRSPTAQAR
jgi:Na+-driven multidrug efflux pump